MPVSGSNAGDGVAFMVGAGLVFEIIAAACSSPQTTEINAASRSETLMKWVHSGIGGSAVFIVVAAYIDPAHAKPIVAGGAVAAVMMYGSYWHARRAGLKSLKPGTEGQGSPAYRSLGMVT